MAGRLTRGAALALLLLLGTAVSLAAAQGYTAPFGGGEEAYEAYTGSAGASQAPQPTPSPPPPPPSTRFVAGAGPAAAPPSAEAATVVIRPWALPGGNVAPFGERSVKVGDSVRFEWTGLHGVYRIPSGTCPQTFTDVAPLEEVAPPTSGGSVTYRFRSAGMYWFACPVDGHCEAGMLIKFVAA